jgi:3-phenylpropionate/trans-cinnamate dioxygenase ferredoxin reductase subunit
MPTSADPMSHAIAFIGAGVASVSAIESLRERGHTGPITLFSAEERLPYDRPPLSKAVLLGEAPQGVALRPEEFYSRHDIDLRLGVDVTSLEPQRRRISDSHGGVTRADAIVLATGGTARELAIPGAGLDGVCVLRGLDDALDLESRLQPGARLVVVGGGFIGTEVAAAARSRGLQVTIVEALPALLARVLPELARHVVAHHRARGVVVRAGVGVESFTGRGRVDGVRLVGGEVIPADLVVVGVGMRPRDELATAAGLIVGDGVHVDSNARSSVHGVYAIGDVANAPDGQGGRRRTEHWQAAVDGGKRLAATLLGEETGAPAPPWFWSDQFDLNIQVVGHPRDEDARIVRGDPQEGRSTVLFHRAGILTAAATLNNGREIRPATDLIRAKIAVDLDALADSTMDLRRLAKSWIRHASPLRAEV